MSASDAPSIATLFPPAGPGTRIADVLVPVAVDTAYSYRVPDGLTMEVGDCVRVQLGQRETFGLVAAVGEDERRGGNLKPILGRVDAPRLGLALMQTLDWLARYYIAPRGMVAKLAMRGPEVEKPEKPRIGVRLTGALPHRMTPPRARLIKAAEGGLVWRKRDLLDAAACSAGVLDALVDEGVFETLALGADPVVPPDPGHAPARLGPEQAAAVAAIAEAQRQRGYGTFLLEGVTGSGKTEVYFEAVAESLRLGRQALVLLPEIALTPEFLGRFEKRFGVAPVPWHSGVAASRRSRIWHGVADGTLRVAIGARSALFLPFAELGLIVVDEEHEAAYKQDEGVRYHARDMAVVRGRFENATVVLASATPSLETRVNAAQGRYGHLHLPSRHGGRAMPEISTIDLTRHPPPRGQWLSQRLIDTARETLSRGEQVLFFLNRRGYAPLTLCRACGHRWQCPQCAAWLVEHRFRRALVCHHCGHVERRPETCTACGAENSLTACGPGVERLAEEVAKTFPEARAITLSSDFPGGTERLKRELEAVAQGEFPIVIGTQLIAKGHNFPLLTLAAVVDADLGLVSSDPRAGERTVQVLAQVTGRAGRGDRPGRGVLQTYQPAHPAIRALVAGDIEGFYAQEIEARRAAGLPPFGRLISIVISANERSAAETYARALASAAVNVGAGAFDVLGPADPPLALLRGRHRVRLIFRSARGIDLQGGVRAALAAAGPARGSVRAEIDVDPMSFF